MPVGNDSPPPVTQAHHVHQGVAITRYAVGGSDVRRAPVVLVHGGNEAGWVWERYARFLAEDGWDVVVFDWLHHGRSERLPAAEFLSRSILDVARHELPAGIETLGPNRPAPILVGHSMGALAVLAFAAAAPVRAVALLAPTCPAHVHAEPLVVPVDSGVPFPPPPLDMAREMFFTGLGEAEAAQCYARLEPESPRAVLEATRGMLRPDLDAVTVPGLVLAAELDRLTSPVVARRLAALLSAEYAVVPAVGHCGLLLAEDGWRVGAQLLRTFVRAHGETPTAT
ncbi:Uncharacterised protein [Amycolatopsis camponoti]|uniref:AB hydrolase-1 domain-containing protein n=1 Tax=Amycolatopsis camponoti TaxID=2606593 RepID=A0A6I8M3W8_9PSEU|nr:alpha/beta fold hydrolase [Amycolatopsis camponoti]VVJ22731.1 Uncharacterised protein [Amycolatopsis camponoti]